MGCSDSADLVLGGAAFRAHPIRGGDSIESLHRAGNARGSNADGPNATPRPGLSIPPIGGSTRFAARVQAAVESHFVEPLGAADDWNVWDECRATCSGGRRDAVVCAT